MNKIMVSVFMLAFYSGAVMAEIDECEKATELKFIGVGDSVSKLMTRVGPPDYKDVKEYRETDTWVYFEACGNQTVFSFSVRNGRVVRIDREIAR